MKRKDYRQQGDVLIESWGHRLHLPHHAKRVRAVRGRLILRRGELSGHAHAVESGPGIELYRCHDELLYLRVARPGPVVVRHEEHARITLPGPRGAMPAVYRIRVVKEFDHFREEQRGVAD